jgi:hypothetical protein
MVRNECEGEAGFLRPERIPDQVVGRMLFTGQRITDLNHKTSLLSYIAIESHVYLRHRGSQLHSIPLAVPAAHERKQARRVRDAQVWRLSEGAAINLGGD